MSVFGVSAEEEEIYRHFLRNPGSRSADVPLPPEGDRELVRHCLERLRERGLLRECGDPPGALTPTHPDVATARLMDQRLQELHEEILHVTQSRYVVDALRAEMNPSLSATRGVEQLTDLTQIRTRIDDLAFFAREEILSVEPYDALTPANIANARPLDTRCLRRGVRIRNVVLARALTHAPTVAYLRELAGHGARIRVADDVSERILVYDRRVALVPVDPDDTARGALLAHESGLISNIIALFEKIWEQAEDLLSVVDEPETAPALTEMEQRVLSSMVTARKDEAGARELGVSVRTYRRHVADLMRTLGASSRAQAALLAREHGWI